ncbi:copper amine oxidase N-terminal domain-containing protein [Paenibacillus polymyxa]|uniref:copper amine oxidase N-terminal domain-containing protein n=1 Tax=Paenibacillus polymyxa TaxID=1406 RepID=UPI0025B6829D|nr:copper amine oxidase N-terminal domain-containing protein [Paenibacillus polymyxa]MDN4083032.1 copper amine oxidase N-terminal domain-containing protein [Paenibacillus polymyxa]MDN4087716.1 copper amine oxidase N-terminal domain-containing protein [Paenibacillus polymyxa]MDN4107170.1 copper amine oxidase N-terminal domain-containing protein [Paenibacillus polymyxa]
MRNTWTALLACILVLGLAAGTAEAKQGHRNDQENKQEANTSDKDRNEKSSKKDKHNEIKKNTPVAVTDDTYGESKDQKGRKGHNGYNGLLQAVENTKDKPAGAVIANLLLTKYPERLTPEQVTELELIRNSDKALTKAAELLDENGNVTDAVYMQEEAVLADVSNLDSYKKLDVFSRKAGRSSGMKLFVNGEKYDAEPINRNGTTLVPFRTASEALNAKVSWDPKEKAVTVSRNGVSVKLFVNSAKAYINGQPYSIEQPASIVDGTTMVPVRVIGEALGANVKWEPESQSVVVYEQSTISEAL